MKQNSIKVRIIGIPKGEPPLWVREKWVGLELPLAGGSAPRNFLAFGAVAGPRSWIGQVWGLLLGRAERILGYAVYADRAVGILAESSPAAAAWWRENAGELVAPGRFLVFHADECEVSRD